MSMLSHVDHISSLALSPMSDTNSTVSTIGQLGAQTRQYRVPTMDVYHDAEMRCLRVYIELPGVPAKNVNITIGPSSLLHQNRITIYGISLPPHSRVAIQPSAGKMEGAGALAVGMVLFT